MIERSGQVMLFFYAVFLALLMSGLLQLTALPRIGGLTVMTIGLGMLLISMIIAVFTPWLMPAMVLAILGLAIDYAGINVAKGTVVAEAAIAAFTATVFFGWIVYVVQRRYHAFNVRERVHIIHVK